MFKILRLFKEEKSKVKASEVESLNQKSCPILHQANINSSDKENLTPLHYAIINGNYIATTRLIEGKADVNAADKYKCTPIHFAIKNMHFSMVKLLIEAQADICYKDLYGLTPFHKALAFCSGASKIALLIVENRAILFEKAYHNNYHIQLLLRSEIYSEEDKKGVIICEFKHQFYSALQKLTPLLIQSLQIIFDYCLDDRVSPRELAEIYKSFLLGDKATQLSIKFAPFSSGKKISHAKVFEGTVLDDLTSTIEQDAVKLFGDDSELT